MAQPSVDQLIRLSPRSELASEIEAFAIDRQARGLSPRTIQFYSAMLALFRAGMAAQGVTTVEALTPTVLRIFLLNFSKSHNPGGTHAVFRAVKVFLRWYESEYEPTGWKNPIAKVPAPKNALDPLPPIDLDAFHKMLSTCGPDPNGRRDYAVLLVLLDSGCRASELVALDWGDCDLNTGALLVRHGKGHKTRSVFVGPKTRRAIWGYRRRRPAALADDAPLFATDTGGRLSYFGLREIVRRRAKLAQVPAPSLHSFRRGFAIGSLRAGMDLVSLQRLLGHSSLAIVSRYLCQVDGDLQAAHEKAGVVERLLKKSA